MTDENQSKEKEDEKSTTTTQGADFHQIVRVLVLAVGVLVAIIFLVWLFSQLFLPFVVLLESGGGDEMFLSCSLADSHSEHMKISWLKSNNISSYEEIPEEEKRNLSAESERWLNISALNDTEVRVREYNPVKYKNLSEEEKELFKDSLNSRVYFDGSDWYRNSSFGTKSDKILYQRDIYQCTLSLRD
jgi:hypothetical protein